MQKPGNRNKTLVEELHLLVKCNDMLIVNSDFEAALPDADGRRRAPGDIGVLSMGGDAAVRRNTESANCAGLDP